MSSDLLKGLNIQQQRAVQETDGPVLILAGAGSGKTRVLTHKVAYLILHKKVSPFNVFMVTFTNKAAGEMKNRIQSLLGTQHHDMPFAGTFHSLCVRILREEGKHLGLPTGFVIYDEDDQMDAIKEAMKQLSLDTKKTNPRAVLSTISEAKNELITATEYPQYARGYFQEAVAKVYLAYQKILLANEAMDFDDLLMRTVILFRRFPDILNKYQEKMHYLLIDEYQDTNHAQYVISTLLAGRYRNICVVGDASQSIYRFRGADWRNIANFKRDYPDAKEFHLEQNYRSTQTILDAAHAVISRNTSHPVLKLWTDKSGGEDISLYEARTERDEAAFLATTLLQSGRPASDFAVLYRTNAQSRTVEESFLRAGIPYVLVGGTRFYSRKEIKDVLAYLRLIAHPKDTVARNRIEKLGKGRYGKFQAFLESQDDDRTLIARSTLELMDAIFRVTGYLELYDPENEEQAARLENIKELRSVAAEYPLLSDFLDTVSLLEQEPKNLHQNSEDKKGNAATLMTLHAAKGLEFPVVFMVGMEEGLFPHSRSIMDKEALEEERRLCYVGITRAKEKLYMTYADRRLFFGSRTQNMISRFVAELPEDVLKRNVSIDASSGFDEDNLLL